MVARRVRVLGRHPLHREAPVPLTSICGERFLGAVPRKIEVSMARGDLCRACFRRPPLIRLGRHQRTLVRRCLSSPLSRCVPAGRREREAVDALVARGLLAAVVGLPGVYRIASEDLAVHLRGAELQHRGE